MTEAEARSVHESRYSKVHTEAGENTGVDTGAEAEADTGAEARSVHESRYRSDGRGGTMW
jgi:hypothetical protein